MTEPTRIAAITGGATGIGGTTAQLLRDQGWIVHVLDRSVSGDDEFTHACDVTDAAALADIAYKIGPVDAVVTAAGVNLRPHDGPAQRLELDAWDTTLAVNLTGTMLTVRAFYPHIRDAGAIVTIGSTAGISAMPWADAYTATKGAVVALTRSWAVDYSRYGIRVNCICPGATETAMMDGILDEFDEKNRLNTPQQRFASRDEIAAVIAFAVSPAATYLSGAIIPVDGGATAHTAGLPFPNRRPRS
ncbi:hypothetical protein CH306_26705 [Rhodococcus sp. 15-725-2-2b]|uniref:SDR family NAD(P)-dependent oxidoreductase n=1 Tax=unclassified Rhodococcus (in: high G+C Gram-positive bacteria) TaxID=192944 RepID=UPI000B9A7B7D|nr:MULTISPECIES: SDR family oxidoreductase [unclassified Rhodococcus (in: high G+C Gram-positive bacteria)]OZC63533.1 hypothetical protein CH277_21955 [Rhodococcus sp. 06-469-3-2]OZD40698.1 hypothetical protein CH264_23640 [Rhodococcus sp. 06-1477-1A]OZE67194.1 hypothetical protein CH306_26705 [Rhodococcus sp. 15-725-2-2b]